MYIWKNLILCLYIQGGPKLGLQLLNHLFCIHILSLDLNYKNNLKPLFYANLVDVET